MSAPSSNVVKLSYREKVPVAAMKDVLKTCMTEKLTGAKYDGDESSESVKQLSDLIRNKMKELGSDRYKFVIQVALGERRDQGVRMATRCFWDANTDNQASETFINDQIFCVATAFAVYLY